MFGVGEMVEVELVGSSVKCVLKGGFVGGLELVLDLK